MNQINDDELKPCPFCGGKLSYFGREVNHGTGEVVNNFIHPMLEGKNICPLSKLVFTSDSWNRRAEFGKEEIKSVRNETGNKVTVNGYVNGQIKIIFEGTGVTVGIDQNGAREIIQLLSGAVDNFPKEQAE